MNQEKNKLQTKTHRTPALCLFAHCLIGCRLIKMLFCISIKSAVAHTFNCFSASILVFRSFVQFDLYFRFAYYSIYDLVPCVALHFTIISNIWIKPNNQYINWTVKYIHHSQLFNIWRHMISNAIRFGEVNAGVTNFQCQLWEEKKGRREYIYTILNDEQIWI